MIRLQRISTADGFLYEYMEQLITAAFPPEEHRPLEAVSYTHLDVYKRQLMSTRSPILH